MNERLRERWTTLVAAVTAMPPVRRAAVLGAGAGALALAIWLAWWVQRPLAAPAFAGVAPAANAAGERPDAAERSGARRAPTADRNGEEPPAVEAGPIEYQRAVERGAEERIESLLATVVGTGKVVARVAASVDFSRTERTEETYDPDKTVVRENHSAREETSAPKAGAGAPARGADGTGEPAGGAGRRVERRDETQSYEVSKTVSRTVAPVGAVKSLSVAVLIDGTYRDEGGSRVFVPRSDEEIERLKTLVASAVGLSEARGDRLEVTSAPFQTPEPPARLLVQAPDWAPVLLARALGAAIVLGVLLLLVRLVQAPTLAGVPARPQPGGVVTGGPGQGAGELARENVALVQQNPERAAQLVRRWLLEAEPRTSRP